MPAQAAPGPRSARTKRNAAKVITSDYSSDGSIESARVNKETVALIASSVAVVPSALTASEQQVTTVTKTTTVTTTKKSVKGSDEPVVQSKSSGAVTSSTTKTTRSSNRETEQNESNVLLEKLRTSTPRQASASANVVFSFNDISTTNGVNLEEHVPFKEYRDAGEYWKWVQSVGPPSHRQCLNRNDFVFDSQQIPEDGLHIFEIVTAATWNQTGCTCNAEYVTSQPGAPSRTCESNDSEQSVARIVPPHPVRIVFGIAKTSIGRRLLVRFSGWNWFVTIRQEQQLHDVHVIDIGHMAAPAVHRNHHIFLVNLHQRHQHLQTQAKWKRLLFALRHPRETR